MLKTIKNLILVIVLIATCFLLAQSRKFHFFPTKNEIKLDEQSIYDISVTDDKYFIIANKKLYIIDENYNVENIVNLIQENYFSATALYVTTNKNKVYVYGVDSYPNTSFIKAEKIVEFTSDGQFVRNVYEKTYEEGEGGLEKTIFDLYVKDGELYALDSSDNILLVKKVDNNNPKTTHDVKIIFEKEFNDTIKDVKSSIFYNELYVKLLFGEIYKKSLNDDNMHLLTQEERKQYESQIQEYRNQIVSLQIDKKFFLKNMLFFIALIFVSIFLLIKIIKFFRKEIIHANKTTIILILFIAISIGFFVKYGFKVTHESVKSELSSITNSIALSIKDNLTNINSNVLVDENMDLTEEYKQTIRDCKYILNNIAQTRSQDKVLLLNLYIINDKGDAYALENYTSSLIYGDIYKGEYVEEVKKLRKANTLEKSYIKDERFGKSLVNEVYVKDEKAGIIYMVQGFTDYDTLGDTTRNLIIDVVVKLVAILAFLWALIDGAGTFINDIKQYIIAEDKQSLDSRVNLSTTYVFLAKLIVDMDSALLVMIVSAMCQDLSPQAFAVMFAIPITTYNFGCTLGGIISSTFVSFFGEKKSVKISSIITIIAFATMTYAVVSNNIYLLAGAKFIEGIFFYSITYPIIEGIPYGIKDDTKRLKWVSKIGSSKIIGRIVTVTLALAISQVIGFAGIYIVCGIISAIILLLARIVFVNKNEGIDEIENTSIKDTIKSWKMAVNPQVLFYLIAITSVFVGITGYSGYLFPLMSKRYGVSSATLTHIDIITYLCNYLGVANLFVSKNKKSSDSPITLLILSGVLILSLTINTSILWLFIVLMMLSILVNPLNVIKIYLFANIAQKVGYDQKDAQKKFNTFESMFNSTRTPILGALCSISTTFCCVALGLYTMILPTIYKFVQNKRNKKIEEKKQNINKG